MQAPEYAETEAGKDHVREVRGALLLLSMAAAVRPDIIEDHLDTLLQVHQHLQCFRLLVVLAAYR